MKWVSISHLFCNVYLIEVIIVFSSKKRVAMIKAGWCVVCVVDFLASSIIWVVQSDHPVADLGLAYKPEVVIEKIKISYKKNDFSSILTVEHCFLVSGNWHYLKQMQLKITFYISQYSVAILFMWCGEFTIIWYEISSGFCIPTITKIGSFSLSYQNMKMGAFLSHSRKIWTRKFKS